MTPTLVSEQQHENHQPTAPHGSVEISNDELAMWLLLDVEPAGVCAPAYESRQTK